MLRSDFLAALGSTTVAYDLPSVTPISTIGVAGPFTGPDRRIGEALADGIRAVIDDANRLRGPLDRGFQIRTFDDQNTVAAATQAASFAIGDGSVLAVIGHVSSSATLVAIPTYANAQMPLISPISTDDRITQTTYRNVFRLQTRDSDEGTLFARYVAAQYHPAKPHLFVQDAEYGSDVANGFITEMRGRRLEATYTQFHYEKADFAKVAADALAARQPDYIFLAGLVRDMGPLVPALRAAGYTGPLGASEGFFDGGTLKLGAAANDLVVSTSMPYLPLAPSTTRLRSDYEARYGPLTPIAAFGYAAGQIVISTARRTGASARNVLLSGIRQTLPAGTIVGNFTFSASGDPLDPQLYFYSMRDAKFSYVRQAHPSAFMLK